MTLPRHVTAGTTYGLARRTSQRCFLFRPDVDRKMENLFWYCLGVTAEEFGVEVHGATLMSSHPHLTITDVHGVLPDFLREFHRLLANATKCLLGWPEEVFNADSTSVVHLLDAAVIVDNLGYGIANPVSAFAVRQAHEWPGATVCAADIGVRVVVAHRPTVYFRASNPRWPSRVALRLTMPRQVIDELGGADAGRAAIAAAVRRYEEKAWAEAKRLGRGFLGARKSMQVRITARSSSWEKFGARNPTFAARGNRESARLAVLALRGFRAAYREALELWRCGVRDVMFPFGTWLMRVFHGAASESAASRA